MPAVVEESPKGELEERVLRVLPVLQFLHFFVLLRITVAQFLRVDGVKVGGVRGVKNVGDVRRLLLAHCLKIDPVKERVDLDLLRSVQAQPLLGAAAQPHDQVHGRLGEVGLARDLQRFFPVYDLHTISVGNVNKDLLYQSRAS